MLGPTNVGGSLAHSTAFARLLLGCANRQSKIKLIIYRPLSRCLVLCDCGLPTSRVQRRFRDKRLFSKEDNIKVQCREKVLDKVRPVESVQEWWEETSSTILRVGHDVLGMTTGRRPPGDKETWWWNDKVQEVIKLESGNEDMGNIEKARGHRYIQAGKQGGKESSNNNQGAGNERVV